MNKEVALQEWWRSACPLFEHIGLTVESVEDEIYRCHVPLTKANSNHFNTMHAAIQMAVAEALGGIVGMSIISPDDRARVFGAVRSVSVEFLYPARTSVIAETRFETDIANQLRAAIANGEDSEFTLESEVRDESGKIVAKATSKYIVRILRR